MTSPDLGEFRDALETPTKSSMSAFLLGVVCGAASSAAIVSEVSNELTCIFLALVTGGLFPSFIALKPRNPVAVSTGFVATLAALTLVVPTALNYDPPSILEPIGQLGFVNTQTLKL